MHRLSALCGTCLLLLPVAAGALSPYQTLRHDTAAYQDVRSQDLVDGADEEKETGLQAQSELFPDDGRVPDLRKEDPALSAFVTVRVSGVPYPLKDVPLSVWFAPYVRDMADRNIVSGYRDAQGIPTGIFGPQRSVTVEELAKMAIEAAGIDPKSCPAKPKNSAAEGQWSSAYISCAEEHAFVLYADGTIDLHRPATRAEVVMTVLQAFGTSLTDLAAGEQVFSDVSASTLFAPAIKTAVEAGIVSGYADAKGVPTGTFGPENPVNRAEVCKILSRGLQIYH